MSAMIRFLADFCRDHPLEEKIFVCPSFVTGRQIGEALAREAGSWINLRFVTVPALAAEVMAKRGGAGAGKPMTSSAGLALTDRLFRELLAEGKLDYFVLAGASPGLSRSLHRAIRELRLNGLTSADIRPASFLVEQKGREIALLLDRYERALAADGLLDLPGLLEVAVKASVQPPFGSAWILCPTDMRFSRLEADLVRTAAAGRFVLVPSDPVIGLERPPQCWPASAPVDLSAAGRLSWFFEPRQAPPVGKEAGIEIFRALGPANECREILRRLYTEKIPFDQAEVLTPAGSPHATVFYLLAARTNLPVTFGDGIPVCFTSPGRLFFGLAAWLANDFSSDELCRLLETGDLALPGGASGGPLPARTACRHLRNAMIGWGRERYVERLAALRDGKKADLASLSSRLASASARLEVFRGFSLNATGTYGDRGQVYNGSIVTVTTRSGVAGSTLRAGKRWLELALAGSRGLGVNTTPDGQQGEVQMWSGEATLSSSWRWLSLSTGYDRTRNTDDLLIFGNYDVERVHASAQHGIRAFSLSATAEDVRTTRGLGASLVQTRQQTYSGTAALTTRRGTVLSLNAGSFWSNTAPNLDRTLFYGGSYDIRLYRSLHLSAWARRERVLATQRLLDQQNLYAFASIEYALRLLSVGLEYRYNEQLLNEQGLLNPFQFRGHQLRLRLTRSFGIRR